MQRGSWMIRHRAYFVFFIFAIFEWLLHFSIYQLTHFSFSICWTMLFPTNCISHPDNCSGNKIHQIIKYESCIWIETVDAYSNIHIKCFATLITPFIYFTDSFWLALRNIYFIHFWIEMDDIYKDLFYFYFSGLLILLNYFHWYYL